MNSIRLALSPSEEFGREGDDNEKTHHYGDRRGWPRRGGGPLGRESLAPDGSRGHWPDIRRLRGRCGVSSGRIDNSRRHERLRGPTFQSEIRESLREQ